MQTDLPFGVLLVNLGTPEEPDTKHVRRFLREFLSDRRVIDTPKWIWWFILNGFILPFRPKKVRHAYQEIWMSEGSPLRHFSLQQQAQLSQKLLEFYHQPIPVELGMTYGQPSMRDGLLNLRYKGVKRVIVLPLYPQFSATTTGSVFDKIAFLLKKCPHLPEIRMIHDYYNHPAYIFAIAESIRKYRAEHGIPQKLVFSFHGIPKRYKDKGDPYIEQCHETARLIAQNLGLKNQDWIATFQSRLGPAAWVEPYTEDTLLELPSEGIHHIHVVCPGFSVDCLETLEEIAMRNGEAFIEAGGRRFGYIPALNASTAHIQLMAKLVEHQAAGWIHCR